jgi:hypothetical protein
MTNNKSNFKNKLIYNLNNDIYAKIAVFPSGKIGFVAIKDIPIGINPFNLTDNQNISYDFIELEQSDIKFLDPAVKKLVKLFFNLETQTYFIPFFGLNTMNFIMYIQFNEFEANLTYDYSKSDTELINYKTSRLIKKCEELIAPRFKFNVDKIRKSIIPGEISSKKKLLLDSLSKVYCKIDKTTIPKITGTGTIAITDISPNTNPFINTDNTCYYYNSVNLSNTRIENLNNEHVIKIIKDFISPSKKLIYSLPYLGFNSINITFFLNHSDKPNLNIISDGCEYMGFRTNRKIKRGEELFIDYNKYNNKFKELMNFQQINSNSYVCEFMIPSQN